MEIQFQIPTHKRPTKMQRGKKEPAQLICPRCRFSMIVYLPLEDLPRCPECNTKMMIGELLDEGKSY